MHIVVSDLQRLVDFKQIAEHLETLVLVRAKLVRRTAWERHDFFLGIQLTLAALSSAFIQMFDLAKQKQAVQSASAGASGLTTAAFTAITLFLFLLVLSTHQDWDQAADKDKKKQIWQLGILCNFIGAGLLASFILWVKGV